MYPLLSKAVEENLITKNEDRRYELTDAGLAEISIFQAGTPNQPESIEGILTDIESNLSYLEDVPSEKLLPHAMMLEKINSKITRITGTLGPSGENT